MSSVADLPNDEENRAMSRAVELGEETAQQVGCGAEMEVAVAVERMGASGQSSILVGSGEMTPESEVGKDETGLQRRGKTEVHNAHGDERGVAAVDDSRRVDPCSDVASENQQPLSNPDGRGEAVKGRTEIESVCTKDVFLSASQ